MCYIFFILRKTLNLSLFLPNAQSQLSSCFSLNIALGRRFYLTVRRLGIWKIRWSQLKNGILFLFLWWTDVGSWHLNQWKPTFKSLAVIWSNFIIFLYLLFINGARWGPRSVQLHLTSFTYLRNKSSFVKDPYLASIFYSLLIFAQ